MSKQTRKQRRWLRGYVITYWDGRKEVVRQLTIDSRGRRNQWTANLPAHYPYDPTDPGGIRNVRLRKRGLGRTN